MTVQNQELQQDYHKAISVQELAHKGQGPPKATSNPPPLASGVTIRKAELADAEAISRLGTYIFSLSFGWSVEPHELQAYLDASYTKEAIASDIWDPNKDILVATTKRRAKLNTSINGFVQGVDKINNKDSNNSDRDYKGEIGLVTEEQQDYAEDERGEEEETIIGFVQLTRGTKEPCLSHIPAETLVELQRIYLHTEYHGSGVAKLLAKQIESIARDQNFKHIWLGVWEDNGKAQRAYEKWGYRAVGSHDFAIGSVIQTDLILIKEL